MNHNYTILITGNMTESQEQIEPRNLATFAFADNGIERIAWLKRMAAEGATIRIVCDSCVMLGRVEFIDESKPPQTGTGNLVIKAFSLFHFHLDELRGKE